MIGTWQKVETVQKFWFRGGALSLFVNLYRSDKVLKGKARHLQDTLL